MGHKFVIVSASCPSIEAYNHILHPLQVMGFRIIALDEPLTYCVTELLSVWQVTSLPAIRDDNGLFCGRQALMWAQEKGFDIIEDALDACSVTISELKQLTSANRPGGQRVNPVHTL